MARRHTEDGNMDRAETDASDADTVKELCGTVDDDDQEVRTDGGRDAVTADDLLVTDTVTGTVHAYREGESRAVCGHRGTRRNFAEVDTQDAPDAAWRVIECGNCLRALASRYRSGSDAWEAVRALEEDDVVHVYTADGEGVETVVTSEADDLHAEHLGTLYVHLTTAPGTVSYQRDAEDDYRLRVTEGDAPTLDHTDLLDDLDDNPERDVTGLEVVGTHDYYADEDPEEREAVLQAAEQVAAMHDRMAEGTDSSEERLWNVNYATALRDVSYRLRSDEWPLAWLRQKVESKADAYEGYPEEVLDGGPLSEVRDDYAKAKGKAAGYESARDLLDDLAPVDSDDNDDSDDDQDDEERRLDNPAWKDRLRTDGGSELRGGFEPGERVEHDEYGEGEVRAHPDGEHRETEGRAYVYFEDTPETTLLRVWVSNLSRVARTDGGHPPEHDDSQQAREAVEEREPTGRTTPVDGGIIHEVAQSHSFGAGHLKAALERIGPDGDLTTDSLDDLDGRTAEAARTALEQHGEQEAVEARDRLAGRMVWSDEFGAVVEVVDVLDPLPDMVMRGVQSVNVEKPNGTQETTSVDTLVTEDPDPEHLETGDVLALPDGSALVVEGVAPADEAPESAHDGPLYQALVRREEGRCEKHLYGPHNIRQALAGGAIYAGRDHTPERVPFWCEGCQHPHKAEERREDPLLDAAVCSYGCAERVTQDRLASRLEGE
jgi:hypothetical protein